jgi:uncharacterized protein (TIGR00251 family)
MPWCEATPDGCRLRLRVIPRSGRDAVQGRHGDRLKIRLQAPPVGGKANRALLHFLARKLGIPSSSLSLAAGSAGREKTVLAAGVTAEAVRLKLCPDAEHGGPPGRPPPGAPAPQQPG